MYLSGRTQILSFPILDCLQRILNSGFDGVEICLENDDISPEVLDADIAHWIRDHAVNLGLRPCSVSYHKNYIYDDKLFDETKKAIRLTPEFGSNIFVFGGCVRGGDADEWTRKVDRTRALVEVAESSGVILAEEFEPGFIVGSTADLHRLFDAIPSPNLTANLDLGHVFLCDPDPIVAIKSLEGRVSHCHIENMKAGVHKHLPPDEGDMELGQYLSALQGIGFEGPMALDLYGCDYQVIAARAVPYLRQLMDGIKGTVKKSMKTDERVKTSVY